jgi:hypothetical protein
MDEKLIASLFFECTKALTMKTVQPGLRLRQPV